MMAIVINFCLEKARRENAELKLKIQQSKDRMKLLQEYDMVVE